MSRIFDNILQYVLHVACGTVLPVLGAVLIALLLTAAGGIATESPRFDRFADVLGTFVLPVLFALALGYVANRRWRHPWAPFVWVLPLAYFVREIAIWKVYVPGKTYWQDVWDNFFGPNCSDSECLGELLTTAPCLSSIAYSIGAFLAIHVRPLREPPSESAVNRTRTVVAFWLLASLGVSASGMGQAKPKQEEWGEEFNTAGAKLVLKETGRSRTNGQTVVTYNMFASGFPRDAHYVLWTRLVGRASRPVTDALLNDEGKVVSVVADPKRHISEDPINLKVLAGRGEPKLFALVSEDARFRVFAHVVPFPIDVYNGPCHLTAVMTSENYFGIFLRITGFQRGEDLIIDSRSESEGGQSKAKATEQGDYNSTLLPFVKGMRSGKLQFKVTAQSCKLGIELPWGEGSYELQ